MAQRKDISIQFIADKCGVSIATVSRVLNNDRRVASSTRERVLNAMKEYRYEIPAAPEPEIKKIGIIIDTETSDYYMALVLKLHDQMKKAGIQILIGSLDHDPNELSAVLESMYDSGVCGVILVTCPYQAVRGYLSSKIPHVWIDCNDPVELTEDICQVQSDQHYSGMLAAQELYKKGCTRPILLCGPVLSHRTRERIQGFTDEYQKRGIVVTDEQVIQTPQTREILTESRETVRYLVSKGNAFDSIFAISDWRALGAYLALTELGVRVPEDVKVIGYDGVSVASRTVLNITSVQQNIDLIAWNAAELLLKQINHVQISEKRIIVPTSILTGQTL